MSNKCELRTGYVSDYDPKRHMARVIFPDKGNLVSGWLPVSVRNSKTNHDEHHLDINEHVACLFTGNGIEEGIVMSALYDDKNRPPESDPNIRKMIFGDGTEITYDRSNHTEIHKYSDGTGVSYNSQTKEFSVILPDNISSIKINQDTITIRARTIIYETDEVINNGYGHK